MPDQHTKRTESQCRKKIEQELRDRVKDREEVWEEAEAGEGDEDEGSVQAETAFA
ncbi:MAG: hypothetical protein RDU20_03475 [Desulfomonilaceae bacterium]|nr:hypothetical protein [Desulfomonilaceae bacterium]